MPQKLSAQIVCPSPKVWDFDKKRLYWASLVRNGNLDKGLTVTVPKWVLINWPKIPQMTQNVPAQIVCPSPKVWDFDKKKASLGFRIPWVTTFQKKIKHGYM